jgi:hypothetical protein
MREALIQVCIGTQGVGKTYRTLQEVKHYVKTLQRPSLIFDVNFESAYKDFKTIRSKHLDNLKDGKIYKIQPLTDGGNELTDEEQEDLIKTVFQKVQRGLILLEDLTASLPSVRTYQIMKKIATVRHRDQDVITHLQSASKIEQPLWQNMKVLRFHYQEDAISRYKDRISKPEMVLLAEILVNRQREIFNMDRIKYAARERYFVYVDFRTNKIYPTNETLFREACHIYLVKNKAEQRIYSDALEVQKGNRNFKFPEVVNYFFEQKKHYIL